MVELSSFYKLDILNMCFHSTFIKFLLLLSRANDFYFRKIIAVKKSNN